MKIKSIYNFNENKSGSHINSLIKYVLFKFPNIYTKCLIITETFFPYSEVFKNKAVINLKKPLIVTRVRFKTL